MQAPRGRVVVAGSINMDVVARVAAPPRPGETVAGTSLQFHPGGKGANQAVAAARLGARVLLIAKTGTDAFGSELHAFLHEQAVDLRFTLRSESAPTGTALVVVDGEGQNSIIVVPGINQALAADDVRRVDLTRDDVAVTQVEIPAATAAAYLTFARQRGAMTVLNTTPAGRCTRSLLAQADVLVLNETELAVLAADPALGTDDELLSRIDTPRPNDAALVSVARRVRVSDRQVIIVTLGAHGAVALDQNRVLRIAGRKVPVVDTTGAGDCFTGALAARLCAGDNLERALQFANVAASIAVQRAGAGPSMPDHEAVLVALRGSE